MSSLNPVVVSRQNVRKAFILILYLVVGLLDRVLLYPFLILAFSLNFFFFFQVVFGQTNTFSRFLRKAWRNWRKAWIEVWSSRKSTLALAVVEFSMKFKLSNGGVYISACFFVQSSSKNKAVLQLREKQRHWFISLALLLCCSLFYL